MLPCMVSACHFFFFIFSICTCILPSGCFVTDAFTYCGYQRLAASPPFSFALGMFVVENQCATRTSYFHLGQHGELSPTTYPHSCYNLPCRISCNPKWSSHVCRVFNRVTWPASEGRLCVVRCAAFSNFGGLLRVQWRSPNSPFSYMASQNRSGMRLLIRSFRQGLKRQSTWPSWKNPAWWLGSCAPSVLSQCCIPVCCPRSCLLLHPGLSFLFHSASHVWSPAPPQVRPRLLFGSRLPLHPRLLLWPWFLSQSSPRVAAESPAPALELLLSQDLSLAPVPSRVPTRPQLHALAPSWAPGPSRARTQNPCVHQKRWHPRKKWSPMGPCRLLGPGRPVVS